MNFIFSKIGSFFMFPQVKTQHSLSQQYFLVLKPHFTVATLWKTGSPENDLSYCIVQSLELTIGFIPGLSWLSRLQQAVSSDFPSDRPESLIWKKRD